jgi:hypothetical protein
LEFRSCGKQQATYHRFVLEEVKELRRKGDCAGKLPESVPYERCGNQENHQSHSSQSRIEAEGQTKTANHFKGSSA